jgi:hypothetical protein
MAMLTAMMLMMAAADSRPVEFASTTYTADAARSDAMLPASVLAEHNRARAELGLPPLAWNPELAQAAHDYAQALAASGSFEHSDGDEHGENLWMGTRNAYRYGEMVNHWVSEKRSFRRGIAPDLSTTGDWDDVGHYTQIVWRDTREVGCAVASDEADDYLVCRYYPAGNVEGEDPLG